jgi:hypothetical protein
VRRTPILFWVFMSITSYANAATSLDGKWVTDPRHCAFDRMEMINADEAADNITIRNNRFDGYEQQCRILKTEKRGTTITLQMTCSVEGNRLRQTMAVRVLAPNKVRFGQQDETYQRCGPAESREFPIKLDPGVRSKLTLGARSGDATVLGAKGLNSDEALVVFARRHADWADDCERNSVAVDSPNREKEVQECAQVLAKRDGGKSFSATADCNTRTISSSILRGGPYQLAKAKRDEGFVETDWRNQKTGKLTGSCSACDTPHIESVLATLCPRAAKEICGGIVTPGNGGLCTKD